MNAAGAVAGIHVPYRSREERDFDAEVDFVVVGSGAGGATAAVTLARGGARVAIVEAGAWRDPEDYPSSAYGGMRDLMEDWGAQVTRGRALWPVVQARTVGGTTVVNSAICVRTPDDIFEQWARDHGIDDLRARVLSAEDRVEREITRGGGPPCRARTFEHPGQAGRRRSRVVRLTLHAALHEGLRRKRAMPPGLPRPAQAEPEPQLRPRGPRARQHRPLVGAGRAHPLARGRARRRHGPLRPPDDARRRDSLPHPRPEGGRRRGVGHPLARPPAPLGRAEPARSEVLPVPPRNRDLRLLRRPGRHERRRHAGVGQHRLPRRRRG